MFSSMDISEHIDECPYCINRIYKSDNKTLRKISDRHIQEALYRQLKKYGLKKINVPTKGKKHKSDKKRDNQNEPYIKGYGCSEINHSHIGELCIVSGIIKTIKIVDKENVPKHVYIDFLREDGIRVSVLISPKIFLYDKNAEEKVEEIQKEVNSCCSYKQLVCACFGRVHNKNKDGYNVLPMEIESLKINCNQNA